MSEITREGKNFIGFDYKKVMVEKTEASMCLDGYLNFGWIADEHILPENKAGKVVLCLKRNRGIPNKMELTRLERHFESCMDEIAVIKKSQTSVPDMISIGIGVTGTVFMAGATFAVTNDPPVIWLCILLAIPGFVGWILPYFIHKELTKSRKGKLESLLEDKYDEVYEICKKGHDLL